MNPKKPFWFVNPFRSSEEEELLEKVKLLEAELDGLKDAYKRSQDFSVEREKVYEAQRERIDHLEESRNTVVKLKLKAQEENDDLKKKIREQNEADLYFASVKIMRELESGKKKDDPKIGSMLSQQAALSQQMAVCNDPHRAQLGNAGFGGRQYSHPFSMLGGAF